MKEIKVTREEFLQFINEDIPTEKGAASISTYVDRGQIGYERVEIEFPIVIRYGNPVPVVD